MVNKYKLISGNGREVNGLLEADAEDRLGANPVLVNDSLGKPQNGYKKHGDAGDSVFVCPRGGPLCSARLSRPNLWNRRARTLVIQLCAGLL